MISNPETTLVVKRTFSASRDAVFNAWTDPNALKQWFHAGDDMTTPIHEVDLRVGGKYRLGMQAKDDNTLYVVHGTYREVQRPEKLVYTWSWEGQEAAETLVTVLFRELENSTEVVLTHEQFPSVEERDKHHEGWRACFKQLAEMF